MTRLPECLTGISPAGETVEAAEGEQAALTQAAAHQNARLRVSTADEAGLTLWERDYGLSSAGTVQTRRSRVLAAMAGGQTLTCPRLRALCLALTDAERAELDEDFSAWTLTVTAVAEGRVPAGADALAEALERLGPAHLRRNAVARGEIARRDTLFAALFGAVFVQTAG